MSEQTPKNIFIVGATSTGKTTLLKALKEHYDRQCDLPGAQMKRPEVIHEVARTVLERLNFDRDDIASNKDRATGIQRAIMQAQYEAEMAVLLPSSDKGGRWFISDRSGMDPAVYAHIFVGEHAAEKLLTSHIWHDLEQHMKAGVVLFCEAGWRWLTDDGIRLMPKDVNEWTRFDFIFREHLERRGIEFTIIPKKIENIDERIRLAVEAHTR